jgi:hypothetical protein
MTFCRPIDSEREVPPCSDRSDVLTPERPDLSSAAEPHSGTASPQATIVYTPIRITIGDGLKFGCGFLIPVVLAMLFAFVIASVLIVVSVVTGVELPFVDTAAIRNCPVRVSNPDCTSESPTSVTATHWA